MKKNEINNLPSDFKELKPAGYRFTELIKINIYVK